MTLTQKESTLLKDLTSQEQLCVEKYNEYSTKAYDTQLKDIFSKIGQVESHHLDMLNQISGGTVPIISGGGSGSGGGDNSSIPTVTTPTYTQQDNSQNKQKDQHLCSDTLSTEKYVSSIYDTCIFEFKDVNIRNVLNHIQKEEQEHGEKIYNYMDKNGMYS